MADDFKPATPDDLTDIAILPRLVRILTAEIKQSFELLNIKIDRGFAKIEARLDGHGERIAGLEQRVERLELHVRTTNKKR